MTGFLGLALAAALAQAEEPTISCKMDGENFIVTYTGELYQSTDAISWSKVESASSPYQVKVGNKKLFFCTKGGSNQPIVPGGSFSTSLPGGVSLDMVWCSPGSFMMGSPDNEIGHWDNEPLHNVGFSSGFWTGKYEVTQAQYKAVMGNNPSYFDKGDDLPVHDVNWYDAMEFCRTLTQIEKSADRLPEGYVYTLPTEDQWEYACRAGTTTALNNGVDLTDYYKCPEMDEVGWYGFNSGTSEFDYLQGRKIHPVGQKRPNAWGIYDMHGNVMEWCLDWYSVYPSSFVTEPADPDTNEGRVVRGGHYYQDAHHCRSAARFGGYQPHVGGSENGLRVVLAPGSSVASKNIIVSLSEDVNLHMIWIEPGTFMMGSPKDELGRRDDEVQHQVTLTKAYWLGKYEVTQAQYEAVMGTNPSWYKGDDLPVECVSWYDAKEFCSKLTALEREAGRLPEGYRYTLPTEAQWEYACRAGTTTALNSGKNLSKAEICSEMDEVGWYWYNAGIVSYEKGLTCTRPVGEKKSNAWGLYDMHGNVGEWCSDFYEDYPAFAAVDPTGADTGIDRVVRWGSWWHYAWVCRSACRGYDASDAKYTNLGFRVALAPVK